MAMLQRALVLVWSLCCWGALAENKNSSEAFGLRLFGGDGRCRGQLQIQRPGEDWIGVHQWYVYDQFGNRACEELDCGAVLSVEKEAEKFGFAVRVKSSFCNDTSLIDCFRPGKYRAHHDLAQVNCSDSVRLVSGGSLCSGSVQIRDLDQSWTSVCEGAMDRRGEEVLCRELGCGAPLLQGALSPLGQTFHCEGHESALMDCPRNQTRTDPGTCSTLQLTCSDPVRLVGGASRCEGRAELRHRGEWNRMLTFDTWDLEAASAVCRSLDCGSAVSTERIRGPGIGDAWAVNADCVKNRAAVRDCVFTHLSGTDVSLQVACSGQQGAPVETEG